MTTDEKTAGGRAFSDRSTGLTVFGILEIVLGGFCALMLAGMLAGMLLSSALRSGGAAPMTAGTMIPGLLFYVVLAVWFIWMGIGSIKARRWARALWLVSSWLWLVGGICGLGFALVFLPHMYDQMGKSGQMPPGVGAAIKYVTLGFLAVFYVIIPGALVLFYGQRDVKATCERRDPRIRWTDKCPLPVLAVSLVSASCAVSMLFMGFCGWAFPFFGSVLTGMPGAGAVLVTMLLLGYVAWGAYRLSVKAWWCALLLMTAWGSSVTLTFSRVSLMDLYEKMKFPAQQLEMMKQFTLPQAPTMVLFGVLWVVAGLAYLLYTRRYFAPADHA